MIILLHECREQFSALLLAGSSTMIHVEISAHRMSSNRVCTATLFTLESFDCHAKTVQNTYHCHTLCRSGNLLLPRRETPVTATPCHPASVLLPRHLSPPRPVALEASYSIATARPQYCHKIAKLKPHSHTVLMLFGRVVSPLEDSAFRPNPKKTCQQ